MIDSQAQRLEALARLRTDFPLYASECLKIRTKSGAVLPLQLNRAQRYVHAKLEAQRSKTGRVRALILKARQQGFSTYIGARFYWRSSLAKGVQVFILTHEQDATDNLFKMVGRFHEHTPLKPSTGNASAKELVFDKLDSGYSIGTAGTKAVGRSKTTQLLHGSEAAFWPNAPLHFAGVVQTVPDLPGTEIILESTANGVGGEFHERWQQAEAGVGDYIAIFVPWFWSEEYAREVDDDFDLTDEEDEYAEAHGLTLEQMAWRRAKIAELKDPMLFKQEYPSCIMAGMKVGTNRGLVPIENVQVGDVTSRGVVTATKCNGEREAVRVTTSLGYSVVCTPEHLLKVSGGEWGRADSMLGRSIELQAPRFADGYAEVTWSPVPCVESRVIVDERFGRLLGYFMGDGCWHDSALSVVCDGRDTDVIADVTDLIGAFVGKPAHKRVGSKGGGLEVRVGLKRFGEVLDALGVIRATNPHRVVKVPDVIWNSPQAVVREFLRGLFESDGFANFEVGRVSLFSKHLDFLRDVQLLLLGFGVTSRLDSRPATNGQGRSYTANTLGLRVSESAAFAGRVGFVSTRKAGVVRPRANGRPPAPMAMLDVVTAVEPAGLVSVYDLSVPGETCFDANGVLVHNCAAEAFQTTGHDSFIRPEVLLNARKSTRGAFGPLVMGVDPKREGTDRFAIAWRRGRKVEKVTSDPSFIDNVRAAGMLKAHIDTDKPAALFIDAGGGAGIYDILVSWGDPYQSIVKLVNFGSAPIHPPKLDSQGRPMAGYANRRAEMWGLSKEWLEDEGGADIPDLDSLQADACGPGYRRDTNQRLLLESKDEMKRRGIRSPDEWDAIALTFAEPVADRTKERELEIPQFGIV